LDLETDRHIQQAIREHFADATILTIAHRLNTLATYDKIMAIEAGQLVEFGAFSSLLANPDGYLTRLLNSQTND
jgi:ABC-type multidrug transport system fused ATPase/permease subunit